jgi:hypothetical protein
MKNAVIFSIVLVATHAVAWIETALFSISLSSKRRAWPLRPAIHFFRAYHIAILIAYIDSQ